MDPYLKEHPKLSAVPAEIFDALEKNKMCEGVDFASYRGGELDMTASASQFDHLVSDVLDAEGDIEDNTELKASLKRITLYALTKFRAELAAEQVKLVEVPEAPQAKVDDTQKAAASDKKARELYAVIPQVYQFTVATEHIVAATDLLKTRAELEGRAMTKNGSYQLKLQKLLSHPRSSKRKELSTGVTLTIEEEDDATIGTKGEFFPCGKALDLQDACGGVVRVPR